MKTKFDNLVREIEFLQSERRELLALGPMFILVCQNPTLAQAHKEVVLVLLVHRGKKLPLRLSRTARQIFTYFAQHRHLLQSALEIAFGLRSNSICVVRPRSIKEYVRRLRLKIQSTLSEAGLDVGLTDVLRSERSETNVVLYQLRARIEIVDDDSIAEL
jgi:hypothetical protein